MGGFVFLIIIVGLYILSSLKVIQEYERGIKFTFGKYVGVMNPGLRVVLPIVQGYQKVDLRVKTVDVPGQECVTRDNISVHVNAVLFYRIAAAEKAVLDVESYAYATSQLAQTTMRNIVGEVELDELLANREQISERIREIVDKQTDPWGVKVETVELKDVIIPEDMKRTIAKQAEAERERRAVIIKAEGERIAADNLVAAAKLLSQADGALHLRTLHSINDLSSDQSNTVIFAIPIEVLKAVASLGDYDPGKSKGLTM